MTTCPSMHSAHGRQNTSLRVTSNELEPISSYPLINGLACQLWNQTRAEVAKVTGP